MTNPFTKGYCDVTFIDSILIVVTLFGLGFLGLVLFVTYENHIKK